MIKLFKFNVVAFLVAIVALLAIGITPLTSFAANLGVAQGSFYVGQTFGVWLPTSNAGSWHVFSNSNAAVASASFLPNQANVMGLQPGFTVITFCAGTQNQDCYSVNATVVGAGQVLGASTVAAHQPGSWVISGQTVFYVTSSGLIPITTWKIFINNGGKSSLIVPMNDGDSGLPLLSFMTLNDSRVQ